MDDTRISFASDNHAGMHPEVLEALREANSAHAPSYGEGDEYTTRAEEHFRQLFGEQARTYFVFGGTGANVLALQSIRAPHHAICCADAAHINTDETGAPEANLGAKLLAIPTKDGRIDPSELPRFLHDLGNTHRAQPGVLSLTQATEYGTIYPRDTIKELADIAHHHGLSVHMDGARIANATAKLGIPVREFTTDTGIDAVSFGGTKNGLAFGEAVVVLNPRIGSDVLYLRKQRLNLASKMRFLSAQFLAILHDDLWLRSAAHANEMATRLADGVRDISGLTITQPVESNAVFATLPAQAIEQLQSEFVFYTWNAERHEVRWMTAFDTQPSDVDYFVGRIREVLADTLR